MQDKRAGNQIAEFCVIFFNEPLRLPAALQGVSESQIYDSQLYTHIFKGFNLSL